MTESVCVNIYSYQIHTEDIKRHSEKRGGGLFFLFQLLSFTLLLFTQYCCVDALSLIMKDVINNILTIIIGI